MPRLAAKTGGKFSTADILMSDVLRRHAARTMLKTIPASMASTSQLLRSKIGIGRLA